MYDLFLAAIHQYGLPSCIRCDQGRENRLIAQHMIHHRGINCGSALVGSSVHNQRIERFWWDMHRCVIQTLYWLFYFLKHQDMLDSVNEFHLFALQYVFIPWINSALQQFAQGWNSHGIQTKRGLSPHQLFTRGMLQLRDSNYTALDFLIVLMIAMDLTKKMLHSKMLVMMKVFLFHTQVCNYQMIKCSSYSRK